MKSHLPKQSSSPEEKVEMEQSSTITTTNDCTIVVEDVVSPTTNNAATTMDYQSNNNNNNSYYYYNRRHKPLYPRTAYNYFFQHERNCIVLHGLHHTQTIPVSIGRRNCYEQQQPMVLKENISNSTAVQQDDEEQEEVKNEQHVVVTDRVESGGIGMTTTQIPFTDLIRTIVKKWKSLDASSKEYFEEKAHQDMMRYRTELQQYNDNDSTGKNNYNANKQ